ncbi:helix-turn-helix domain-containing protein [Devosia marina]|uniref:DNA-binding protein n=1 Tax=Devosia marina TaxID=2683198 RepID=A0A7X3FRD9_9HYPH|nr:helix-turn-helix domain-containing protein [Devosia marina]MVS99241.1 DNA-binding protein [Devosia marina]
MTQVEAYPLPEFCRTHGIGRTKAYEEINAGRLKARKSGARTIILAEDAEAWLKSLPELSPKAA